MKTLMILRHAQALSTPVGGTDKTRTLSPQGKADARALGKTMAQQDMVPGLVLCSPATRTRETLDCVLESIEGVKSEFPEGFYNANADTYLHGVHACDDSVETLLLVGHNPGVQELATRLVNEDSPALLSRLAGGYAPATLSVLECDVESWEEIQFYQNRLMVILESTEYNGPERPTRWM